MLSLPRPTLLFVDDYQEIRRSFRRNLEHCYACLEASTGREAEAIVATRSVDVVVLDVKLPDMSGIAWLASYRKSRPQARVITISGFLDEGVEAAALSAGAARHMTKPFTAEALRATVESLLTPALPS